MADGESRTSIRVGNGPEVPINLKKDLNAPENDGAREQMAGIFKAGGPSIAADELRLLIERIERLEQEKAALGSDVKDVYTEAKARGYDAKTMRRIVALRKMETHDRLEAEALLDTYAAAVGLQGSFL